MFRKLRFANVKYNHGNKEFGKDITFARRTEFDDYEYYGVQVKHGDVSGGAQGEINELIQQAKEMCIRDRVVATQILQYNRLWQQQVAFQTADLSIDVYKRQSL